MASKEKGEEILEAIRKNSGISKSNVVKKIKGNKKDIFHTIDTFESNDIIHVERTTREHKLYMYYDAQGHEQIIDGLADMRIPLKDYLLFFEEFGMKRKLTTLDKQKIYDHGVSLLLPLIKFTPNLMLFGITSLVGTKLKKETEKTWVHFNRVMSKVMQIIGHLDKETQQRIVGRLYVETGNTQWLNASS